MDNFIFQNPTKILFGRGMEKNVGQEILAYSKNILLHYGTGSIKRTGVYDRVIHSLKEAGIRWVELPGVKPNPRLSLVREGIRLCREEKLDFILAIGGGSAIDSAKAIALGAVYEGDVWDIYAGRVNPTAALPVGTVLTIPAAGSEASTASVITNEDGWYKRGFNSEIIYPKFSILNPELAFTLPKYQVASGSADILAHLMERYFTNTLHVELTDRMIEAIMITLTHHVPKVLEQPENYDSWAEIMWSGTIAHNNLMNTGRVGDWGSHDIEHELSAIYDVAHGAGLAVVFPAWMKYVYRHDVARFCQFAVRVWGVEPDFRSPEETALEGISRLENYFRSIGMPVTLKELGVPDDRLEEMAAKATNNDAYTIGQFVRLKKADVLNILKLTN